MLAPKTRTQTVRFDANGDIKTNNCQFYPHHLYLNMTTADPVTGEPCRVVLPADLSMDIELLSQRRGREKSLLADAAQEPAEDPAEAEKSKQGALQKEKKEAREMELEKKDKDVLVSYVLRSGEAAVASGFVACRKNLTVKSKISHVTVVGE